jgi:hypothetical protein
MKRYCCLLAVVVSAVALLSGCSQPSADKVLGPDWPGGVPTILGTSSGKGFVNAGIPQGVPSRVSYECWLHGLATATERTLDQDLSFREAVATMYACIAQRMPPGWVGHEAAKGDVADLLNYIEAKDPGFRIVPWSGPYK